MLDKLTSADFAPYLQQAFLLSLGPWGQPHDPATHGAARPLELVEVADIGGAPPDASVIRRPFSLIFRDTAGGHLPQRTYAIKHPALGWIDLFLVPIGPDPLGMCYQSIFT
ncbi:MAG: hypothetical protein U0Z44_05935 [Kouleothrix sp.]|jgi:hypothetical protein|nr:hypothetical protein [Kouleothrix sp.]